MSTMKMETAQPPKRRFPTSKLHSAKTQKITTSICEYIY